MNMTLNSRLAGLNFSRLCDTAYKAENLQGLKEANPTLNQLCEDGEALEKLNDECNEHERDYLGEAGRFTKLRNMYNGMGKCLEWTCKQFVSKPDVVVPERLMFESNGHSGEPEQQDEQPKYCSNPFENNDFSGQHRGVIDAFNSASKAVTPEHSGNDSFDRFYEGLDWGSRWNGFIRKYVGDEQGQGEFRDNFHDQAENWNAIQFGHGAILKKREFWVPNCRDISSPLPWASAYTAGWEHFKSNCADIWHSDFMKPQMPTWASSTFEGFRTDLASSFRLLPIWTDCSRPKLEDCISPSRHHSAGIYGTGLPMLMNAMKDLGRGLLKYLVSPVAWVAKVFVAMLIGNTIILLSNALYNGAVGIMWGATWLGQGALKGLNVLWQASKFLVFYPATKILGITVSGLAHAGAGFLYAAMTTAAWTLKALGQFVRFPLQNIAILLWNNLGRPLAWLAGHGLVGVWGACRFAYTAFKAFLHGTALLLQNVGSYLLGRAYFHLVRPCAEFTAKFVLRFVQAAGHLFLAGGQCIYGIVKVAWHFAIRPLVTGAKWVAENLAKLLKMVWNKALLPGLYKCVWTPLKFLTTKFLLFAAAVVQVPFYLLALGLGGLVIGAGFGLSEASLWVKSHWISKAFYPIPYSAWRRTCEYNHLAGVREPLLKATEVRRYDRETAFSPT